MEAAGILPDLGVSRRRVPPPPQFYAYRFPLYCSNQSSGLFDDRL
jgi:hypothetical protein